VLFESVNSSPAFISFGTVMAKKGTKATRKFAASGQLTKTIQARRKHQQIQRKVNKNKNARSKGQERPHVDGDGNEDEEESAKEIKSSKKRYVILYHSVDDTLRLLTTPVQP
jgi:nucleolar complex protein 2